MCSYVREEVDFRLAPELAIRGVVLGPDGAPLANADVLAQNGWSEARATAKSGPDGRFEVGGLQPGTYRVSATQDLAGAGKPGRVELARALDTEVAAGTNDVELRLPRIAVVKGRVLDARGEPLAHVHVLMSSRDGDDSVSATSSEAGSIALRCIEREPYHVLVQRTEPDPDRPGGRRVDPPGFIDLELDWTCDTEHELVLRVPDRPR